MRILLTNDDGFEAPGIVILEKYLKERGHEIIIAAPHKERSAASHSITLFQPLRVLEKKDNVFAITGTPADCVILACEVILEKPIDLVISGINGGQNMGEDVLYSGTVAAAIEAMHFGHKAIAVSIAEYRDQKYETAAEYLCRLLDAKIHELIGNNEIFNVNIPNLDIDEIQGVSITQLGHRKYSDFVVEQVDPRGHKFYWIGGQKPIWKEENGTDCTEISKGYISISALSPNFSNNKSMNKLEKWLDEQKNKIID